jgi:hypothetical protein
LKQNLILAAHCIKEYENDEIFAMVGRFDLVNSNETNWKFRKISHKIIHEDYKWKEQNTSKSNGDIAILVMNDTVRFSDFIQPICLPKSNKNVSNVTAGYGRTDANYASSVTNVPQHVELKSTQNLYECLFASVFSSTVVSPRSFCAKGPSGIPCFGKF